MEDSFEYTNDKVAMIRKNVLPANPHLHLPPTICMLIKSDRRDPGPIEYGNPLFQKYVRDELKSDREWHKRCYKDYEKNMIELWIDFKDMDWRVVEDA